MRLRQIIDERYTASSLLGLSRTPQNAGGRRSPDNKLQIEPSSSICGNYYETVINENSWLKDSNGVPYNQNIPTTKRVRRSGKYTPEEREVIRYFYIVFRYGITVHFCCICL